MKVTEGTDDSRGGEEGGPQALRVVNGRHSDLSSSFVIIIIVIYRNRGEFSDVKNEEQNRLS